MAGELPDIAHVQELAVLQTEQHFEAAWSRLADDKRSEHSQENDDFDVPFQRTFRTTLDEALGFKHVIQTIRKFATFAYGSVEIYYGKFFHLVAFLGGSPVRNSYEFREFEFKYTLTPSQHSFARRYQYDPNVAAKHFIEVFQVIYDLESSSLCLSLLKEAWLFEEELPEEAENLIFTNSLSISFETPSLKAYAMRLQYISPSVLQSMAPWTKKILSCIGIDGIPEAEGVPLERWFERFLGAVGLSGLKYLAFCNSKVTPEVWRALPGISSLERLQISIDFIENPSDYRSKTGWHLWASRLKDCKSLQHVTISGRSLTLNAVESLIKGVFKSDTIFNFMLRHDEYKHYSHDEKLKHHLNMNKAGRRLVYRSPNLIPAIAPILLEYAAKQYSSTGVFTLLRNDFDLAKVFGAVKKRKQKIPSKFH